MARSGPHQTTIGNRDARQVPMAALSVSGQHAGGPSGERDQSWVRIRAPILPPPSRKPRRVRWVIMKSPRLLFGLATGQTSAASEGAQGKAGADRDLANVLATPASSVVGPAMASASRHPLAP